MRYTTKVRPDVEKVARELAMHKINHGPEHWKLLGHLIGYLKGKKTKGIITRKSRRLCFAIPIISQIRKHE